MIWDRENQSVSVTIRLGSVFLDKHCGEEFARDYNCKELCKAFKHSLSFNKLILTLTVANKICLLFAYPLYAHCLPCSCISADRCLQTLQYCLGVLVILLNVLKYYFLCSYSPYYAFLCHVSLWAWRQ